MIGHQQFKKRFARIHYFFRVGDNFHAGFDRADAGGGKYTGPGVHNTEAADADGCLVLKMAKRGDIDAVHARGIENARAGGYADGLAVEGYVDKAQRCGCSGHI